jgi:hypothetical protein
MNWGRSPPAKTIFEKCHGRRRQHSDKAVRPAGRFDPQLNKFPRDQKFVPGDRIETKLLDVQENCLRTYYSRDKRGHLLEANLQPEVARHLVRSANALKLFSKHVGAKQKTQCDDKRFYGAEARTTGYHQVKLGSGAGPV